MASALTTNQTSRRRGHLAPILAMLVVPAFIAEVLSGATPPSVYFSQPNILVSFSLYYGSAALLAREMAIRWGRGWPSVVLLGAAFAVIQEGLGTKVFFDTTRPELSPLVNYGTLGGVHWAFVVQLVIYHAVYSVSIPVLLVELAFRDHRRESWIGKPGLGLACVCLIVVTWLLFLIYPFSPPGGPYLAAALAVVGLCLLARWAPPPLGNPSGHATSWRPLSFLILGVVAAALFFSLSLGGPAASVPPAFIALGLVATAIFTGRQVVRHLDGRQVHAEQRLLALAAGLLSPLILLSFFQEMRGRTGSSLVGIVSAAVLFWLWRRR